MEALIGSNNNLIPRTLLGDDKYRAGYAAQDVRKAFLPAVGCGSLHLRIDDDSEAYCWRRSGFFWRMRASLGLACAQATTLAAQVFGKGNPRSRAGRSSA